MAYTILSEQMIRQEYVNNQRLAEPLLKAVWQSNKCHISELDNVNDNNNDNGKACVSKSGKDNNYMANAL